MTRPDAKPAAELPRHAAIAQLLDLIFDAPEPVASPAEKPLVIATTGMISREVYRHGDRSEHFYMIGSMGLAGVVGLGLASTRPERRVVVFDGDGSALMGLGHLAMIAEQGPTNLLHVVFDNRSYASTGGQRSISDRVPLDRLAAAAGYARALRADDADALGRCWAELAEGPGPSFLLVRVMGGNLADIGRVEIPAEEITSRFRTAASGEA